MTGVYSTIKKELRDIAPTIELKAANWWKTRIRQIKNAFC